MYAFCDTAIESISIPSLLIDIEEGWCADTLKLNKFNVASNNHFFSVYDNKFLIKKSSLENDEFDILVCAVRDIVNAKIPDFIEVISSYAFQNTHKLRRVEFSPNSKLRIIERSAFEKSSFESFELPNHVISIDFNAFSGCLNLRKFLIRENSMLKTIKNDIFTDTSIRSLYISKFLKPHLFYINDEYVVQIIEIDENYNVDLNNLYVFFEFYNALVMIPSSLNNYDFSNYPIDDYLGIN